MADIADVRTRVRRALGDLGARFRVSLPGGDTEYEIGHTRVYGVELDRVEGSVVTPIPAADYTLNATEGLVVLNAAIPSTAQLLVTGHFYSLFEDFEIDAYIDAALARHTFDRENVTRTRDGNGFIRYVKTPYTLADIEPVEEEALVIMAQIEALWDMATDAASDIDVWTAEGTHLARGQRFDQLMEMINALQARYKEMCDALNIGLNRIQMATLRRVSHTTGRLVPIFVEREYDESGPDSYPKRILPPIDSPYEDESGLPSPIWGPGY
ncbi:hypothetical protein GCM10010149_89360 [Nonomuraea roseoviolacea subsp. roseoviolacea]|uniref:hypothetical protein n=1 Tax=Nonomuraea roseoviolacea TaxID=103837 RepID=UPI0031D35AF9